MQKLLLPLFALALLSVAVPATGADRSGEPTAEALGLSTADWPWWRGPERNGAAFSDQTPPLAWSEDQNVVWKVEIPGRGHSSPVVVGNQVFITTADEQERALVLCFDRRTGESLWTAVVHQGDFPEKSNKRSSNASPTPACDGERVFVNFLHDGAAYTSALDRSGTLLWQTKITDYVVHQGYGSSPAIYGPLVIVSADNKGGGAIAGLNRESGQIVWKVQRPELPNYSSPVIHTVAGRAQLLFTGCDVVAGFDPLTGEKLWEAPGATTECVTTTVTDGELVFTSGGYPKNHIAAMRGDGSGEVVWENTVRIYVPSMLISDGYLYTVADSGIAMCWNAGTGEEMWKHRLGGTFNASPVLVGETIFVTNEEGTTFIFKADPGKYVPVAENELGDDIYATPTICGSRIYMRVTEDRDGKRQEMLYCLGKRDN